MLEGPLSSTTCHTTSNSSIMESASTKKIFPCNTCNLEFKDSQAQRTHMREPWHVYNLKRRMTDLPPVSADDYAESVATKLVSSKQEPSDTTDARAVMRRRSPPRRTQVLDEVEDHIDEQPQSNSCLFCLADSGTPESNLEHMSSEHGLYIPQVEHLSSLETTIDYLRTVVTQYKECLYCGTIKQSAEGVRQHMLDRGHCMINFEREPELLEFWEFSESDIDTSDDEEKHELDEDPRLADTSKDPLQGEYTLPSGKIVGSKSKAREARRFARRTAVLASKESKDQATLENSTDQTEIISASRPTDSLTTTQQGSQQNMITKRDAVGLTGVSDQQVRALVTLQRKTQKQEAIVRASASWAGDKGGIHQRHYKTKMNLRDG